MYPANDTRYEEVGVLTNTAFGLERLLTWLRKTEKNRATTIGKSALENGFFANVIEIGNDLGLALSTDGVGTKVLVASELHKYDTIGIDCVAMNVNDIICVGAEPVAMLDYIGIEKATPDVLDAIGKGLYEGANQAGISFVGGEVSQLPAIIRGPRKDEGLDLIGMCVGVVPLSRINVGQHVTPGDVIVGLASSGIHSNGLTLARNVFERARVPLGRTYDELGGITLGEELLKPTRIYVALIKELLNADPELPINALINITSDGLLNLARIKKAVGFIIDRLPTPQPIFSLIQRLGDISNAEMFRVFNMGIGFCVVVSNEERALQAVRETAAKHGIRSLEIGRVVEDDRRRVCILEHELVGEDDAFTHAPGASS
jgi:phosphoribosylformylglycinamidine cyclo-ligase